MHALALGWQGTHGRELRAVLHPNRRTVVGEDRIRLLGYVEAVSARHPRALRQCHKHPRSLTRRCQDEQGLDEVRAGEARRLAQDGYEPVLKRTRWCVLKRKSNLTGKQRFRLRELLRYNLKTVRAYLLKEDFQQFWEYQS